MAPGRARGSNRIRCGRGSVRWADPGGADWRCVRCCDRAYGSCPACRCGPARTALLKLGTLRRALPAWNTRPVVIVSSKRWHSPMVRPRTVSRCKRLCRPPRPSWTPVRASGRPWRSHRVDVLARIQKFAEVAISGNPGCRNARRPSACRRRGDSPERRRSRRTVHHSNQASPSVIGASRTDFNHPQHNGFTRLGHHHSFPRRVRHDGRKANAALAITD